MGISQSYISRLEKRIISRLRRRCRSSAEQAAKAGREGRRAHAGKKENLETNTVSRFSFLPAWASPSRTSPAWKSASSPVCGGRCRSSAEQAAKAGRRPPRLKMKTLKPTRRFRCFLLPAWASPSRTSPAWKSASSPVCGGDAEAQLNRRQRQAERPPPRPCGQRKP